MWYYIHFFLIFVKLSLHFCIFAFFLVEICICFEALLSVITYGVVNNCKLQCDR